MRALPLFCVVGSAALHAVAWVTLGLGRRVVESEPAASLQTVVETVLPAPPAPQAAALPAAAVAPPTPPSSEAKPTVTATTWRAPAAPAGVDRAPDPQPTATPTEVPAGPEQASPVAQTVTAQRSRGWQPSGPPAGLRLPVAMRDGVPSADLVIDPSGREFLDRARSLGMRFILFQDGSLDFFLELQGETLHQAVRRGEVDARQFSRRARDLAGVRNFDRLRDDVAERYGLDASRCRLAALVPNGVDASFQRAEHEALASLGLAATEVRVLCGALTNDPETPIHINHALTASGQWLEIRQ